MTEQEMMDIWMKMATPGDEHKTLDKTAGDWTVAVKTWMSPTQPPSEAAGTAKISVLLDGRIRQEEFHCDFGGMPFHGLGLVGFDNFTRQYWMAWADNFSTAMMFMRGSASADGKVITLVGTVNKAAQNLRDVPMRCVYRFIDDNHHVFEGYEHVPGQPEAQTLEIDYRR